ncbi:MAG: PKD domain-containing protein [Saprospiraceae bacterium]
MSTGTSSSTYDECAPDTVVLSTNAVTANGATSDNQEIVYQELCGDGQLIAKVSALTGGYAGLFVRESNAAGARKGAIMTQKGSTVFRHLRITTNGIQFQASHMASGHQWLKINRSGTQVIGSWSTNGTSWNVAFNTTLSMTDCVFIGMSAYRNTGGSSITATFTNISVAQSDAIPATEVAFADSTLAAQGGDTVQICVNLQNPCYCSPVTVDVALTTDSLPHLVGFEPQTLTFEEGDTVQCFTVVLEESDTSGTYTFELTNLEGGNDSEIGAIGELVLEVEANEEEEAEPFTLCGNFVKTPPEIGENDIVYSDRFANLYLEEEILKSATLTDNCGCGEFSNTDIPGVEESYFELTFDDCVNNYDTAFHESQGDLGLMRRKVACRVFTYLSQLITPKSPACSGEEPAKVNVRFVAYNSQPVQNYVGTSTLAGASPYYENVLEGGILDCLPWRVINNGHYTVLGGHSDDELFHGEVAVDFAKQFYLGDDPPGTGDTSAYDLYSVLLHEALHFLGFASLIQPITGIPSVQAGAISYSRYDSFLKLAGGANVVARDNTDPYRWNLNIDAADLHKSCIDSGAVDMIFPPLSGDSLPIYTGNASFGGAALLGTAFSHLNDSCQGGVTNYLMKPSFNPGVRMEPGDAERRVLCALGYQVEGIEDCACVASGDHDFTEGCGGEPLELEICDDVTELIIHLDSLTGNDQPGVQIGHLTSLTPDAGTLEFIDSVTIRFTPCAPGTHRFKYIPVADSCQEGSTVLINIKVTKCLDDCSFFTTEDPVNGGYNNNPCNLICNPEVFINSPEDIVGSIETNAGGFCYDLPGWFAATGTPDYVGEPSFTPNSGSIQMQSEESSEAAFTPVSIGAGAYFFSFYAAAAPNANQTGNMTLKALLVDEGIVTQFARESGVPNNIEGIDFNEGDSLSAGSITFPFTDSTFTHRSISCIEIYSGGAYHALCFYPATPTGFRIRSFIDQVELIPDNFSAGADTTVSCGQPVTLEGDDYCMVSDLTILYTWTDEEDNTLLVYRVRKNLDGSTDIFSGASGTDTLSALPAVEVIPLLTTTYTLHREIAPGSASGLELCLPEDELVVTVTSIEPEDPAFTYDNSECNLEVSFNAVSEHEVHFWYFDTDTVVQSTQANPTFTFSAPGVYTVRHIAGDSCVAAETEQDVLVLLPPDAGFDYDLTQCTGPFIVEVTAENTLPGNTYAWLFDGNGSQSTATATHTFYTPGEHHIKLTVANACGEDAEEIIINIVDCTGTEACACDSTNTIGEEGVTTKVSEAIEDDLLLALSPASTTPQQVCIAGKLQLDQHYNFFNSTLRMLPGASIEVTTGFALGIVNSFLHGCDQMWRGIEVETGGSIKTVANTTIADAQYGVYFQSGGGGTIDENRFLRNFVGIYQAQTPVMVSTHCYDNFFLGGTLKDEFTGQTAAPENLPEIEMNKPLAGIWIDRSPGFLIYNCYFENSAIGVGTRRTNLTLKANRFSDIVNNGAYQSSGSWSAAFPNGMDGYGVLAFGVANTISISGLGMETNSTATFDNCTSGIDLTGYGGSITLNRMVDVDTGIVARMVNVGGLKIRQNRIPILNMASASAKVNRRG